MCKQILRKLIFKPIHEEETEQLIRWLTGDSWPYHLHTQPTEKTVREWIAKGKYAEPDNLPFFGYIPGEKSPVAYVCLEDLCDLTPLFDLRIRSSYRGKGLGCQVLEWLTRYVFTQTDKRRFEGHTRADNIGMQKVFKNCHWVQEAYYRQAWPDQDGSMHDAVAYAILKHDWESGTVTPVPW